MCFSNIHTTHFSKNEATQKFTFVLPYEIALFLHLHFQDKKNKIKFAYFIIKKILFLANAEVSNAIGPYPYGSL